MVVVERRLATLLCSATALLFASAVLLAFGAISMGTTAADDGADIGGGLAVLAGAGGVVVSACLLLAGIARHVSADRRRRAADLAGHEGT